MKTKAIMMGFAILLSSDCLLKAQTAQASLVLCHCYNGNALDGTANANNGTSYGAALSEDRYNASGSAYQFYGYASSSILVPDNATLDLESHFTIMAWIKPYAGYGSPVINHIDIVSKWGDAGAAYLMALTPDGKLIGWTYNGSKGSYYVGNTVIPSDRWTHVAISFDGNYIRHYINGKPDAQFQTSIIPQNSPYPLRIGTEAQGTRTGGFTGLIDDVKIFKSTLSKADIKRWKDYACSPSAPSYINTRAWSDEATCSKPSQPFTTSVQKTQHTTVGALGSPYPNPVAANSFFNIALQLPAGVDQAEIRIMNDAGVVVQVVPVALKQQEAKIFTDNWEKGLYFYQLYSSSGVGSTGKILVLE